MIPGYVMATYGTGVFSKPLNLSTVSRRVGKAMRRADRWRMFHLRRTQKDWGPARHYTDSLSHFRNLMQAGTAGFELVVGVYDGTEVGIRPLVKVRKVDVGFPSVQTDGTPAIDEIYGAVSAQFKDKFGFVNLGICANKEGQHGVCNALDFGVTKPSTAEGIHQAILEEANWLRARMLQDIDGEPGGLPVNGIIVMDQVCSRDYTAWHYYSGTPHVSHVHVSGVPNPLPGWI